jgi:two-component system NarL family response regulator
VNAANHRIIVEVSHADPLIAVGLRAALSWQVDLEVLEAGRAAAGRHDARYVEITDYASALVRLARQPGGALMDGTRPAVLVVTSCEREWELRRALEAGVRGYLPTACTVDELTDAVRAIGAGMRHVSARGARLLANIVGHEDLTRRERQVLSLLAEGHGNKSIARDLDIGLGTVKTHLRAIYGKLNATCRTEAVTVAERRGVLDLASPRQHRRPPAWLASTSAASATGMVIAR